MNAILKNFIAGDVRKIEDVNQVHVSINQAGDDVLAAGIDHGRAGRNVWHRLVRASELDALTINHDRLPG